MAAFFNRRQLSVASLTLAALASSHSTGARAADLQNSAGGISLLVDTNLSHASRPRLTQGDEQPLQLALAVEREDWRKASREVVIDAMPSSQLAPLSAPIALNADLGPLRIADRTARGIALAVDTNISRLPSVRTVRTEQAPLQLALAPQRDDWRGASRLREPEPVIDAVPAGALNTGQGPLVAPSLQLAAESDPLRIASLSRSKKTKAAKLPELPPSEPVVQQPAVNEAPPAPIPTWEIALADRTLYSTLTRWSVSAGWQLVWELDVDYPIETRTVLEGTFAEAIGMVATSLESARVPMQAIFYAGNKVLRIVAKGSE
jgi:hypothetical protein